MEYRSWVQGTTFCTRMDYLSPFFNEATYVLGVERLLDIEDDIPEKAQVMRVLLMELNRISSHLVCHRDRRHGDRRPDRDDDRLPRARAGARPVRADHRPADEPRVHPPRRRRPGPPARRPRRDPRLRRPDAQAPARVRRALQRQPDLQGPPRGRRPPRPGRLPGAGPHRPAAALDRLRLGPAQDAALLRLRGLRLRRPDVGHRRRLRPLPGAPRRDGRVAADRRAGRQPARRPRGRAGDGRRQEDRLAQPARRSAPTAWATPSTTSATSWASRWRR